MWIPSIHASRLPRAYPYTPVVVCRPGLGGQAGACDWVWRLALRILSVDTSRSVAHTPHMSRSIRISEKSYQRLREVSETEGRTLTAVVERLVRCAGVEVVVRAEAPPGGGVVAKNTAEGSVVEGSVFTSEPVVVTSEMLDEKRWVTSVRAEEADSNAK